MQPKPSAVFQHTPYRKVSHQTWTPPRHNLHNQVWKAGWSTPKTHMPCLHHLPLPTTTLRQVKRVILNRPPEKGLLGQILTYLQSKREVWGHHGQGGVLNGRPSFCPYGYPPSWVMQMEPQPMPTRSPSTPASIRFLAWAAVTTGDGRSRKRNVRLVSPPCPGAS